MQWLLASAEGLTLFLLVLVTWRTRARIEHLIGLHEARTEERLREAVRETEARLLAEVSGELVSLERSVVRSVTEAVETMHEEETPHGGGVS